VSILPNDSKAVLGLFCFYFSSAWLAEVVTW